MHPPSHSHRTAGPQTYSCDTVIRNTTKLHYIFRRFCPTRLRRRQLSTDLPYCSRNTHYSKYYDHHDCIRVPTCLAWHLSLTKVYQPPTLTTTYRSPHLPLTVLKLYCTASKNPETTSGVSHYPRLAPLPPTTSYDTNSTQNLPYTPRPHSDPQLTKPSITRWLKDGSPTTHPSQLKYLAAINHIAQPRPSDTSPRPVPATGLQN